MAKHQSTSDNVDYSCHKLRMLRHLTGQVQPRLQGYSSCSLSVTNGITKLISVTFPPVPDVFEKEKRPEEYSALLRTWGRQDKID